jgi:glycosyltransferase involved in cell wall biosynthesis
MSETPRIVHISGSVPPRVCGIADNVRMLTDSLRTEGAAVEVWTRQGETEERPGYRPIVPSWDPAGVDALAAELRRVRPAVVHLQYERSIYENSAAVSMRLPGMIRRAGLPLVVTMHSLDGPAHWGKTHRLALMPLLLAARDIVVCSGRQEKALKRLPTLARKVHLLPIGPSFLPLADPAARARQLGPTGPLRLLYFGFIWRGRNIELLLQTLAALPPDTTLDILGGIKDPAYQDELKALAATLGVAERVCFKGEVSAAAVSAAMLEADIALLPFETGVSTGRGTFMLALAHHLPIVTMSVPDNVSPHFRHGENLLLTPAGDADAFIEETKRLAGDAELRTRLSAGAAELAREWSWPNIARRTLALPTYREALSR